MSICHYYVLIYIYIRTGPLFPFSFKVCLSLLMFQLIYIPFNLNNKLCCHSLPEWIVDIIFWHNLAALIQSQILSCFDKMLIPQYVTCWILFITQVTCRRLWVMTSSATLGAVRKGRGFTSQQENIIPQATVRETHWASSQSCLKTQRQRRLCLIHTRTR